MGRWDSHRGRGERGSTTGRNPDWHAGTELTGREIDRKFANSLGVHLWLQRLVHLQSRRFVIHGRLPCGGQVAQSVEQGTENPRVGGSIPSLTTIFNGLCDP